MLAACAVDLQERLSLPEVPKSGTREELASLICPRIQRLLDRDMERLLQLCYQIDLGEEKLKNILYHTPVMTMAMELSLALVDRQLLKLQLRAKYRNE
ncbi:hypothetical protein ADIS_1850 [Lunatimonas lonarensis]|uniref:Uncharacterized protein n=1 Tax=Lunatimonas lonarensis TaxID=1232681 RepID=R7ZU10_9BACT|nr:hypothetical protein ADIS_1850 [Lunatimonas lonarensis]